MLSHLITRNWLEIWMRKEKKPDAQKGLWFLYRDGINIIDESYIKRFYN
jgi:hypothetical protein